MVTSTRRPLAALESGGQSGAVHIVPWSTWRDRWPQAAQYRWPLAAQAELVLRWDACVLTWDRWPLRVGRATLAERGCTFAHSRGCTFALSGTPFSPSRRGRRSSTVPTTHRAMTHEPWSAEAAEASVTLVRTRRPLAALESGGQSSAVHIVLWSTWRCRGCTFALSGTPFSPSGRGRRSSTVPTTLSHGVLRLLRRL